MNIFKVIRKTTSKIERIHSEYLAGALGASHQSDRVLFSEFWKLAVGSDENWPVPTNVEIKTETVIEGGQRVDITIFDLDLSRCLGVEVKTTEASTTDGQLAAYQIGLGLKDWGELKHELVVRMAYLTPFNHQRSPERAAHSRREFCSFSADHSEATHISWMDVADIELESEDIVWSQHREYVRSEMCAPESKEMREFGSFFSAKPMENFRNELEATGVGIKGGVTPFDAIEDVDRLVSALRFLIECPKAKRHLHRPDKMEHDLKKRFSESDHGPKHDALFALAEEYEGVWLGSGKSSYGLRVAHQASPGGVSLCTVSENEIAIGQKRRAKSSSLDS